MHEKWYVLRNNRKVTNKLKFLSSICPQLIFSVSRASLPRPHFDRRLCVGASIDTIHQRRLCPLTRGVVLAKGRCLQVRVLEFRRGLREFDGRRVVEDGNPVEKNRTDYKPMFQTQQRTWRCVNFTGGSLDLYVAEDLINFVIDYLDKDPRSGYLRNCFSA